MRNFTLILFMLFGVLGSFAQVQNVTFNTIPPFNESDEITITVSDIDPSLWGVSDVYLWAWYYDLTDANSMDSPNNGEWTNSDEAQKLTNNGDGTYSITLTPTTFYGTTGIGRMGMLVKAKDGSNDKKTQDNYLEVGTFEVTFNSPVDDVTPVENGEDLLVSATALVASNFELFENNVSIDTQNGITDYSYNYTVTAAADLELRVTEAGTTNMTSKAFSVTIAPPLNELPVPAGMKDGLNLDPNDSSIATLVLYAPGKAFARVIGNFNSTDWVSNDVYLMNKDSAQDRFWITLTNLPNDADILYQYVVNDQITIADPYSTLILDETEDDDITDVTFPNLPDYPTGKTNHAVSWFKTGQAAYDWQITNFQRPAVTDLVIYELLIRDFDLLHSFDAVKARLDYLEGLGVNAIELMPVSEFDGNNSWGYNPSFHMALDKYYGTPTAFKQLVDECHARGIAVILDVVYNQATGQNPYFRMWNDCDGCYEGKPNTQNPFFNVDTPNTSFSFFNDIDHESAATEAYIDRLNEYWLTEYNVDGYRFDFTKGFTNTVSDGNGFDQSRIDILKRMNAEIKAVDANAYVILEHLAGNDEETDLIEDGMLVWSNLNFTYSQSSMGYDNSDFGWISYKTRGWTTPSNIAYMESHDEERMMYRNIEFGNSNSAPTYDVKDLETALNRVELAGAFYFTIPGPKMIWQFGELGYQFSINRCVDTSQGIDESCRTDKKPIRWDYVNNADRKDVYDLYAKLIDLKLNENIFKSDDFTVEATNDFKKTIHITDASATGDAIKYITIIGNFGVTSTTVVPDFQETGTWYDLLDDNNTSINVTNVTAPITLQAGEFKVYANEMRVLSTPEFVNGNINFNVSPNPANSNFSISEKVQEVTIYSITGVKVKEFTGDFEKGAKFNVNELNTGLYIVQVQNKEGNTSVTRLIKQ